MLDKLTRWVLVNFGIMPPPDDADKLQISELEMKGLERATCFDNLGNAYGREHGQRPATIGLVLSTSPLALFIW